MPALIAAISRPGIHRRITSGVVVVSTAALCMFLAYLRPLDDIVLTVIVFLISLLGFSALSLLTFDSVTAWRAVDYPWVCASFVAAVVAIIALADFSKQQDYIRETNVYRFRLAHLRESARQIGERCKLEQEADTLKIEVAKRLCSHLAIDMESFDQIFVFLDTPPAIIDGTQELSPLLLQFWLPDFTQYIEIARRVFKDDTHWIAFIGAVEGAVTAESTYMKMLQTLQSRKYHWHRFAIGTNLRYWYFIVAFFVGLRLSRTTAELLQASQAERARKDDAKMDTYNPTAIRLPPILS